MGWRPRYRTLYVTAAAGLEYQPDRPRLSREAPPARPAIQWLGGHPGEPPTKAIRENWRFPFKIDVHRWPCRPAKRRPQARSPSTHPAWRPSIDAPWLPANADAWRSIVCPKLSPLPIWHRGRSCRASGASFAGHPPPDRRVERLIPRSTGAFARYRPAPAPGMSPGPRRMRRG